MLGAGERADQEEEVATCGKERSACDKEQKVRNKKVKNKNSTKDAACTRLVVPLKTRHSTEDEAYYGGHGPNAGSASWLRPQQASSLSSRLAISTSSTHTLAPVVQRVRELEENSEVSDLNRRARFDHEERPILVAKFNQCGHNTPLKDRIAQLGPYKDFRKSTRQKEE